MSIFMQKKRLLSYVCALLMLLVCIGQFTPYWRWGEETVQTASISELVWFPDNHADLKTYLGLSKDTFTLAGTIILVPILTLLLSAVCSILCLLRHDSVLTALCCILCGSVIVIGYLFTPELRMGAWCWAHVALGAVTLVLSLLMLLNRKKA